MPERITDALYGAARAMSTAEQAARTDALTPEQLHVAVDQCGLLVLHVAGLAERWQRAAHRACRAFLDRGPSTVADLSIADLSDRHLADRGLIARRIADALATVHGPLGDVRRRALGLYRALDHLAGPVHELGHTARGITLTL